MRDRRIKQLQAELLTKNEHLATKNREIATKDGRIQQLKNELGVGVVCIYYYTYLFSSCQTLLATKNREIAVIKGRVQQLMKVRCSAHDFPYSSLKFQINDELVATKNREIATKVRKIAGQSDRIEQLEVKVVN